MASAFFSSSETAILSVNKFKIENLAQKGNKRAKVVKQLLENQKKVLTTILVVNNVINVLITSITTALIIDLFGDNSMILLISSIIITFLLLIFGEITPKTIATQKSEAIILNFSYPLSIFNFLLKPFVFCLTKIVNIFTFFIDHDKNELITGEEIKTIVAASHEQGVLEKDEHSMINNILEFGEISAKSIMLPRIDIVSLNCDATYEDVENLFRKEKFSRIPIYNENIDDIIGILHFKDFIFTSREDFDLKVIMRDVFYVYETKQIGELLMEMKNKKTHMAIILDEYGGTKGLITLEDILSKIVGQVYDEFDDNEDDFTKVNDKEYIIDGMLNLNDVNNLIGCNLQSEEVDTIAGYVLELFGKVAGENDFIKENNLTYTIISMQKNRIEKLKIELD